MASGAEVGTAYVTIMPSTDRFPGALNNQIGGGIRQTGQSSGRSFGGAFAAAAGAVIAAAGIASFLKGSIEEATEALKVGKLTAQVIKTTGGAAKITAEQVGELSSAISKKVGVDDEAIQSSANLLLTFTNVKNEVGKGNKIFDEATQLTVDMGAALGQDASAGAIQLGKALNDPIKGISALSRVGVSFTEDQKKTIKALVEAGDTLGAQKIIIGELKKEFGGAAEAIATDGDKLTVAWGNLKETVGTALLPVVSKVAKALQSGVESASAWFEEFNKATLTPAMKAVAEWFQDNLLPVLKDVAGFVKDHLIAAWERLSKFFANHVVPAVGAVVDAIAGIAADIAPSLQGVMTGLGEVADFLYDQFGAAFDWAAGVLTNTVIPAIGDLVTAVLNMMPDIQPAIDSLKTIFGAVVKFIEDNFVPAFDAVRDLLVDHVVPALGKVVKAAADLIKFLTPVITWVIGRLGDLVAFLSAVVLPALGAVFDFIGDNANWAVPILAGIAAIGLAWWGLTIALALNPFTAALIAAIAIATAIYTHWDQLKRNLADLWQQIKPIFDFVVAAFKGMWIGIKWVWDNLLYPFFVAFPEKLGAFFADAAGWLIDAGKNVLTGLGKGITWVWDNVIKMFFWDLPAKIGGFLVDAIGWLWQAGWNILKGMWSGITTAAEKVWTFFKELPGKIVDFFIGLPGKLWDIGMNAIHALFGGLDEGSKGKAKIFSDDLVGGIKDALGIKSPSKVFMEIGRNLSAGLVKGLIRDNPVKFATKIFGGMSAAIKALFGANKLTLSDLLAAKNTKYKSIIDALIGGAGLGGGGLGGAFTGSLGNIGGDLQGWIARAVGITGVPTSWIGPLMSLAMHESGGNPRAINLWDSNAARGTPSKGLLQTIDPTFNAYKMPGLEDIWNPVHNAVAAIRYMIARYGSIFNIASYTPSGFVGGYEAGTNYIPKTGLALVHQGEAIIPAKYNQAAAGSGGQWGGGIDYERLAGALARSLSRVSVALDGQAVGRVQAATATRLARR